VTPISIWIACAGATASALKLGVSTITASASPALFAGRSKKLTRPSGQGHKRRPRFVEPQPPAVWASAVRGPNSFYGRVFQDSSVL